MSKFLAILGLAALTACAGAPGQAEHVVIYADHGANVHVHIDGSGTGGTATATPTTTVPISVSGIPGV